MRVMLDWERPWDIDLPSHSETRSSRLDRMQMSQQMSSMQEESGTLTTGLANSELWRRDRVPMWRRLARRQRIELDTDDDWK